MPIATQRGGAELMLLQLLRESRDMAINWTVIFLEDGPMTSEARSLGARVIKHEAGRLRHPAKLARCIAVIAAEMRRQRAIGVGWMAKAQVYSGPAALLSGRPAVWYQLGIPTHRDYLDRFATVLPAKGILTCSHAGATAQEELPPRRPVRVVHPGVDIGRFDPSELPPPAEARRQLGLPVDSQLIGLVGRLQRWKGVHHLIQALPLIIDRHVDAHCVVVGGAHSLEPGYEDHLRALVTSLKLDQHVTFAGFQQNVPIWMQAMDVVVHASTNEPFGLVVIEAMALGKPVVATSAGGPTEVITDGVDGILCPPDDPVALAWSILRYLDDRGFAESAGARARTRAHEFSAHRYAQSFVNALLELTA